MAGRKAIAIRPVERSQLPSVEDIPTQRALDQIIKTVDTIQDRRNRDVVTFSLVVGTNRVPHGLGRKCAGYNLTPTVANATFAHALDTTNPRPDLEVWVTVIGVAQANAILEVF